MTSPVLLRRAPAALLLAFLAACGDDEKLGPGSFTLVPDATTLAIVPGTSASTELSVNRSGTFTGPVEITAEGLSAGLSAVVTPGIVDEGRTRSRITITADPSVAVGSGSFTIRARAAGQPDQTATVTVSIV